MAQSLSRLWTHLIFSTKERFPFLSDAQLRRDTQAYLATVLRSYDCETIVVNGTANHVHALFALSRKIFYFYSREGNQTNIIQLG